MSKYNGRRIIHPDFGKGTLHWKVGEEMYMVIYDNPNPALHCCYGYGPKNQCWWIIEHTLLSNFSRYRLIENYQEAPKDSKYAHVITKIRQRQAKRKEQGYVF